MQAHTDLIQRLKLAAAQGRDLLPLLDAEREHLRRCPACRASVARFITAAAGREAAMDAALARLEELGRLEEPPAYPQFDLAFLDQPQSFGTSASARLWSSSRVLLPGGVHRQVRQLAEVGLRVRIDEQAMNASFHGLSRDLSASVAPARPRARGESSAGRGQILTLPDPEGNLEIIVKVQAAGHGRSDLSMEVRSLAPADRAIEAEAELLYPTGAESRHMRRGKVTFVDLNPDQYTIEIKPIREEQSGTVWRLNIALERI